MHAAVRFYSDEGRKVLVVPVSDIEDFDENNCNNVPYHVKKYDGDNYHFSPAEVLSAGQKEDLINESKRYKKKKLRRSDGLEKLCKTKTIERKNPKIIREKLKKIAQKHNAHKEMKTFIVSRKKLIISSDSDTDNQEQQKKSATLPPAPTECQKPVSPVAGTSTQTVNPNFSTPSRLSDILSRNRDIPDTLSLDRDISVTHDTSAVASDIQANTSSSSNDENVSNDENMSNDENVAANGIVESPRRRRWRGRKFDIYRPRVQVDPDNIQDLADVFSNTLQAEVKEVDGKGKELYDIEGDEIYVGCNKNIQLAFWEYMKHRGPTKFLRELLEILWGKRNLINRCFKLSKISTEIENRSPRKVFTPAKYKVLRQLYKDYLHETYGHSSKKKNTQKHEQSNWLQDSRYPPAKLRKNLVITFRYNDKVILFQLIFL